MSARKPRSIGSVDDSWARWKIRCSWYYDEPRSSPDAKILLVAKYDHIPHNEIKWRREKPGDTVPGDDPGITSGNEFCLCVERGFYPTLVSCFDIHPFMLESRFLILHANSLIFKECCLGY